MKQRQGARAVKRSQSRAEAFEKANINKCNTLKEEECGVKVIEWSLKKVRFTFYGVEFSFKPIIPVIGRFCDCSHCLFSRRRRGVSVCSVFNQHCRPAHVSRRGNVLPGRSGGNDHQYLYLHGHERSAGILAAYRRRTDGHFRWIHGRPTNIQIHSGCVVKTPVCRSGALCGAALQPPRVFWDSALYRRSNTGFSISRHPRCQMPPRTADYNEAAFSLRQRQT